MSAHDDAQAWHERRAAQDPDHDRYSSCWCCCWSCDPELRGTGLGNPHWAAASAEAGTDG